MSIISKSNFAVVAGLICLMASGALAKNEKLPEINLQTRCKASAEAVKAMYGDQSTMTVNAFETCMSSEQKARDALTAAWKDVPSSYRSFCIAPNVFSPSYIEWITCFEMKMDVKNLRSKEVGASKPPSGICPFVQFDVDGSVKSVNACS